MVKQHINLSIDSEKIRLAKRLNINISQSLEDYLTAIFNEKLASKDVDIIKLSDEIRELEDQARNVQIKLMDKHALRESILSKQDKEQKEIDEYNTKVIRGMKAAGLHESLLD